MFHVYTVRQKVNVALRTKKETKNETYMQTFVQKYAGGINNVFMQVKSPNLLNDNIKEIKCTRILWGALIE